MKALVVLVHYFKAEANPRHASVDAARQADRQTAVERVIRGYRGLFGSTSVIDFQKQAFAETSGQGPQIDIRVLTVPECTLVTPAFRNRHGVGETAALIENPRTLGFTAYQLFARSAQDYDWFIYSEDDLLVRDPQLFDKLNWFNTTFGDRRVLSPNRFEWNDHAAKQKTFIDGDLSLPTQRRLTGFVHDVDMLTASPLGAPVSLRRARNPHSGFFAITRSQLAYWMAQKHWLDRDVSFVTPLESAATLGLTKTFSVYKPYGTSASFLEIEHLDDRFSSLKLPFIPASQTVEATS